MLIAISSSIGIVQISQVSVMDDLRFIASSLVSVVAAGGAVYGTFGGIDAAALKGRDGASQRDGGTSHGRDRDYCDCCFYWSRIWCVWRVIVTVLEVKVYFDFRLYKSQKLCLA